MSFNLFPRKLFALVSSGAVCAWLICALCADSAAQQTSPTRPRRVTRPTQNESNDDRQRTPERANTNDTNVSVETSNTVAPSRGNVNEASSVTTNDPNAQRRAANARRAYEMLQAGQLPPVEFTRPEVAEVLIEAQRAATAKQQQNSEVNV